MGAFTFSRALLVTVAPVALSGCVALAGTEGYQLKDAGFSNVSHYTRKATGKETVWVQSRGEAQAVAKRVHGLVHGRTISADVAVQVALLNNKGLQAAYSGVGTAAAEAWQQSLLVNPVVSIGILGIGAPELGLFRTLEGMVASNVLAVLTRERRVAVADARFKQAQLMAVERTLSLAAETRMAWIEAVAAFERVTYLKQALNTADASSELAAQLGQTGALPKGAQGREHAFFAEIAGQVGQAKLDAQLAKEKLTRLMGLWGSDTNYNVPDRLPTIRGHAKSKPTIEAEALNRRVDLQIAKLELEALARSYRLTDATRTLTDLEIIGGFEAEREIETEVELEDEELVEKSEMKTVVTPQIEVEFAIPIFDSGKARLRKGELAYMRAANELAQKAVDIRSEARSAYTDYRSSREIALHYRDRVVPLRAQIQQESLLTNNGMITNTFELLADARGKINALLQSVDAKSRFWKADANLSATIYGGAAGGDGGGGESASVADAGGPGH